MRIEPYTKKDNVKRYRVYEVCKNGNIKGYWKFENKIYNNNIKYLNFNDYDMAINKCYNLLSISNEKCIALEDTAKNRLFIVYPSKIEILKDVIRITEKNRYKKDVIINEFIYIYGGCTVENDNIFAYKTLIK